MNRVLAQEQGRDRPPRTRLEGWLVRKIRAGSLKALPGYSPPHGRGGSAEQYARALLAGLRTTGADGPAVERLKDDGRAFRSWTESVLPAVSGPAGGPGQGARLAHGFAF